MSSRSYVGALDPDGRTFHARYAHFDGDPDTMPLMLAAVWAQTFHGDTAATVDALLAHDWELIGPDITEQTPPSFPGYRPVPGVGVAFPADECPPRPTTGQITDPTDPSAPSWMYLIDLGRPDTLLLLANTGTWVATSRRGLSTGYGVTVDPH